MKKQVGILVDTTQCIGCMACEDACADRWGFPHTDVHELSCEKNTVVQQYGQTYVARLCMHCEDPTCASVCPVGAIHKTAAGPVVYDVDKCMGCRYCVQACPFQIPKYQWNKPAPKVTKCDMCYPRQLKGKQPACVEVCPAQARIFGFRDDLIEEAKKRIKNNPGTYIQHIFGTTEVGGTSTIYLAGEDFGKLGFPTNLPKRALPKYTWDIMEKIPDYFVWGSTLMAGFWWLTNRKKKVAEYEEQLKRGNAEPAELEIKEQTSGGNDAE
jgi:formate dehydrogenase iron-sulfur subunit